MKPFKKFLTLKEDITNFVNTNLSEARIHIDDYKECLFCLRIYTFDLLLSSREV